MPEQQIFFGQVTLTAAATAKSIYDAVTDTNLTGALPANLPGQCVSLNFSANVDIKVGYGTVDATHGTTLTANTQFVDSASGVSGNTINLSQYQLYSPVASGDATVTIFLRFIG